eukprot:3314387-Rhodomonas_salina.2
MTEAVTPATTPHPSVIPVPPAAHRILLYGAMHATVAVLLCTPGALLLRLRLPLPLPLRLRLRLPLPRTIAVPRQEHRCASAECSNVEWPRNDTNNVKLPHDDTLKDEDASGGDQQR